MKINKYNKKGFTLIELTVVIVLILSIASISTFTVQSYVTWKEGIEAGAKLKEIHIAQKLYLADFPLETPSELADPVNKQKFLNYLDSFNKHLPIINAKKKDGGSELEINILVIPPTLLLNNQEYDPTGKKDNLWDAGQF